MSFPEGIKENRAYFFAFLAVGPVRVGTDIGATGKRRGRIRVDTLSFNTPQVSGLGGQAAAVRHGVGLENGKARAPRRETED